MKSGKKKEKTWKRKEGQKKRKTSMFKIISMSTLSKSMNQIQALKRYLIILWIMLIK